ncbi:MAG: PQQ-dependent sugar dehydrogenase [Bacteroidales bacterium]|nr:PQQ-dependent sugar dehydrogenase [Bacteroidales bacterium]MCF8350540.1 PQQ-dependent sugar dehydrogenase [Bacteroidales bacterium]MCF8376587.1 PQQ-dependent sugar dehydrogenase [Bacteroidales bacterium]MCF8401172.1 PQQ-dependent sugar dehydrogenase [Bacteroidales bacterium]
MNKNMFLSLSLLLIVVTCKSQKDKAELLDKIKLPVGFHIEIYADDVPNARGMDLAEDGTLFVGSRDKGTVYAVTPSRNVLVIDEGLNMPAGLDYYKGDLYVSSLSEILKYPNILNKLADPPEAELVYGDYPTDTWHGWKFIKFGPDGKLYVPVGAPCNVCLEENPVFASITRIDQDGSNMEIVAHGIRNTVGFDWNPETGDLWFTDNGRDYMGDNLPPDELNRLTETGQHFGFPFVHGNDIHDLEFWDQRPENFSWIKPQVNLKAHVAALGMRFYTATLFPEKYRGGIFFAEHGSWNRSSKIGYRVMFVPVENNQAQGLEVFASGWLQGEEAWGRPVDVVVMPDGSLLVSDDMDGTIYRIYTKSY